MDVRRHVNSDRTLAGVALAFLATVLAMLLTLVLTARAVLPRTAAVGQFYGLLGWVGTLLVVATVGLALLRLASPDRTVTGGLLALAALGHAPLWLAMWLGLVDVGVMSVLDGLSRVVFYPALAAFAVAVLLRPLFEARRGPTPARPPDRPQQPRP